MRGFWKAVVAAVAMCVPSFAADKDPLLDRLTGQWVLTGAIDGQNTTHDIDAQWILQNSYLRLTEVSREKDASGKPQYEAEVLIAYDAARKHYVCFWYDTTGIAAPDSGTGIAFRAGDTLPFVFKMGGSAFHNTFAYDAKLDRWSWAMDGEEKGQLVPFARVALSRK